MKAECSLVGRREFMGGMLALGACGCRATGWFGSSELVRLGVLSDIHLTTPGSEDTFIKALRYFDSRRVDGVVIAGDLADRGRVSQLKLAADAWRTVFPGDRRSDGAHVEKLFVYGNHDVQGWEWDDLPQADEATKRAAEIDCDRPLICIQHPHPKGTCIGDWASCCDDGSSTRALAACPNAVVFSGHSHYTLTDERSVWQGGFTSINTSSLSETSYDYSLREGCRVFDYEISAVLVEDDLDLVQVQRRIIAPDHHLSPSAPPRPGSCPFALDELPLKGHYRFEVRPIECFGKKGAPLVSDVIFLEGQTIL